MFKGLAEKLEKALKSGSQNDWSTFKKAKNAVSHSKSAPNLHIIAIN